MRCSIFGAIKRPGLTEVVIVLSAGQLSHGLTQKARMPPIFKKHGCVCIKSHCCVYLLIYTISISIVIIAERLSKPLRTHPHFSPKRAKAIILDEQKASLGYCPHSNDDSVNKTPPLQWHERRIHLQIRRLSIGLCTKNLPIFPEEFIGLIK
ncbi:hypothetical protein CEXT_169271 [Caerostris extrusa]|uniref:Uncharacterized protein n=1 Tax=Caerostris extrusa TaxID=172846 RepID=A0AAV4TP33_CAEEX|nr:hypothetical protein CEXT_169271 [Caerostris extrusa]